MITGVRLGSTGTVPVVVGNGAGVRLSPLAGASNVGVGDIETRGVGVGSTLDIAVAVGGMLVGDGIRIGVDFTFLVPWTV